MYSCERSYHFRMFLEPICCSVCNTGLLIRDIADIKPPGSDDAIEQSDTITIRCIVMHA